MTASDTSLAPPARAAIALQTGPGLIIGVLALCGALVSLTQTLLVPLIPLLPNLLGSSESNTSWVVTSSLLAGAVATPVFGRLADIFGRRPMMVTALLCLLVGSLICAVTSTLTPQLVGRSLQGASIGLIPLAIAVIRDELPEHRVGSGIALISATLGIGGGIGLPLAGAMVENLDWHSVYWATAAGAVVVLIATLGVVPPTGTRTGEPFDPLGAVGLAAAVLCFLIPISKGSDWGWTSPSVLGLLAASAVLGVGWGTYELRRSHPLVDLRLTRSRPLLLANLAGPCLGVAMFSIVLTTTAVVQLPKVTGYGFGSSLVAAGLAMLPGTLAMVIGSPLSARLSTARGPKVTVIAGASVIAAGYLLRILFTASYLEVVLGTTVIFAGVGLAYGALPAVINANVPAAVTAGANGVNSLSRVLGASIGSALATAILSGMTDTVVGQSVPTEAAFALVHAIALVCAVGAVGLAVAMPNRA